MSLREQLQNLSEKFQVGGQTLPEDWKQKYSTNPYFKDREDWGDKLSQKFPNAKNTVKDSIYTVAKQSGVDPGILYTSAMEEGMKLALNGKDTFERREGYNQFRKSNPKGAQEFPIDGGYFYGLNTFGDKYGQTIKPSSLPRGFKYAPYEQKDSEGNKLYTSAAFRSHDDAIAAKAAMMKQVEGAMTARLQKNGLNLSPEARKFFDMVGYNMGEDKTIEMIKSYEQKGYLKGDKFLDPSFQPASWKEPYTNVQRRYQNYRILNDQGYFKDYPVIPQEQGQEIVTTSKQSGGNVPYSQKNYNVKDIKNFYTNMISSDWYKERLDNNGYDKNTQLKRLNNINSLKYIEKDKNDSFLDQILNKFSGENVDTRGSLYRGENNEVTYIKNQSDELKAHPRTIISHEFGHSELKDGMSPFENNLIKNSIVNKKATLHNLKPDENKSDINALRYNLYKNNLYNPSTGKYKTKNGNFDRSLLEKVSTDFSTKRLLENFDNKNLEKLMNTVAENNESDDFGIQYAQKGDTVRNNELESTKDWWTRYINSPKYTERLQKEFPDYSTDQIQSELDARKLNLDKSYPVVGEGHFKGFMKDAFGYASPPERDERTSIGLKQKLNNFMEDYISPSSRPVHIKDGTDRETYNHELSHSVDEGGRRIPTSTVANMLRRIRGVRPVQIVGKTDEYIYSRDPENPDTLKVLENMNNYYPIDTELDEQQGRIFPDINWKIGNDPTSYAPKFGYVGSPTEMIARLQPLREDMYKRGFHDSAKEDISEETLKKYIDDRYQSDEEIPSYLLDLLNEVKGSDSGENIKNLEWMLNNIASKSDKNPVPMAQKGGKTNSIKNQLGNLAEKYQVGGCVECDEKRKMQKGGKYDGLRFGKAFKKAMSEGEEGENFEWRGKSYKLEYADEPLVQKPVPEEAIPDRSLPVQNQPAQSVVNTVLPIAKKTFTPTKEVDSTNIKKESEEENIPTGSIEEIVIKKLRNKANNTSSAQKPNDSSSSSPIKISFDHVKENQEYIATSKSEDEVKKSNDSIRQNVSANNISIMTDELGQELKDAYGNLKYMIKSSDYVKQFNTYIDDLNAQEDSNSPVAKQISQQEEIPLGLSNLNFLQNNYNGDTSFVQQDGVWKKVTNNVDGDVNNILTYEKEQGKGNNFVVIDKKNQKLTIYDKNGNKIEDTEVMLGKNKWDSVGMLYSGKNGKHVDYGTGNSSTGAGIFSIGDIEEEAKHYLTKEPLYMLRDEEGNYTNQAMHAPATQGRADRLNNGDMDDNRVTFGCVAGKCGFMKNIHRRRLLNQGDRVYITPEEEGNRMEYKNGELKTIMSQENIKEYEEYGDGYGITRKGRGNYSKNKKPRTVLDIMMNRVGK